MTKNDFFYDLPQELIAQTPLSDRSGSRLMVIDKDRNQPFKECGFRDIADYFTAGDCLVINETKVIPARLIGRKAETEARIELLLLNRLDSDSWEVLVKPGKRLKIGDKVLFGEKDDILQAEILSIMDNGSRTVRFSGYDGVFEEVLAKLGEMPLPPYITKKLEDMDRYQTVYAKNEGSAAAPTAGLHFTNEILDILARKGVSIAKVTLHVGVGTFRPVKVMNITEHQMHSEYYELEKNHAETINNCRAAGGKIICVGTTSLRTIETCANDEGLVSAKTGWTDIFIYPGYRFKVVDALVTNFHLPESTLLMLVSAMAGRERILEAYKTAVEKRFRFFSFGDAMLIGSWGGRK